VPVGLPYGERQVQVEQMRMAGLPLSPRQGTAPSPPGASAGVGPAAPTDGAGLPAELDLLSEMSPSQPWDYTAAPVDPQERMRREVEVSPNAYLRALVARMLGG